MRPLSPGEVERRKPVWQALSNMYLDTENTDAEFESIARAIQASGYSMQEADRIDWTEVFPLVGMNLLSVAGAWSWDAFDVDEIARGVQRLRKSSTWAGRSFTALMARSMRWMYRKDRDGVCRAYARLITKRVI